MTDKTIDLDQHRGMAAQKATDLRRLLADVEANERSLRFRQDELESHLIAAPAASWQEAPEKARYLRTRVEIARVFGRMSHLCCACHAPRNARSAAATPAVRS